MAEREARGRLSEKLCINAGLLVGLAEYFVFYNGGRFHQALGYKTPNQDYQTGEAGEEKITDHFSEKKGLQ